MKMIVWVCVVLAVGLYIAGPIQDPDLWWHIAAGRWILAHGGVPHEDVWGMFSHGQLWRAYSWSCEIVFALADRWWGDHGLLALKLVLSVALAASFSVTYSRLAKDWFLGLLLGIFVTAGCYNHFTLRPQSLVWIWFALLLLVSDQVERHGMNRSRRFALVGLMALWANTHLTALLGIVAATAWSFGKGGAPLQPAIRRSAEVAALTFLGTLITPYFGGEWITFLSKTSHPAAFNVIAEFQPATIMQFPTAFLMLAAMALIFLISGRGRLDSVARLLIWVSFVLAGLAVVKFLPFALILTVAMLARALREVEREGVGDAVGLKNVIEGLRRLRSGSDQIPKEGLAFVFLCLSIVSVYKVWSSPVALEVVPKQAVDFIQEQDLPRPIANVFGHGGYLIYRFSDEHGEPLERVAIDGRTNLIAKDYWKKYLAAARAKRNWREYIDAVNPGTILWRDDSPLGTVLLAENHWCLVHESGPQRARVSVWVKQEYFQSRRDELSSVNCE